MTATTAAPPAPTSSTVPPPPPPAAPFDARLGAREGLAAAVGLLVLLGAGKPLGAATGLAPAIFTLIAAYQLYVPLWLIQRRGEAPESHGIHVHGALLGPLQALRARLVRRRRQQSDTRRRGRRGPVLKVLAHYGRGAQLRGGALANDLGRALLLAVVTFPPFFFLHHQWQLFMGAGGYTFRVPPDLVEVWLKNTFLIALPEELFYRGFLEHRLDRWWPTRRFVLLIPISRTVIVASALFALGHFLGEWNPARLGPFFPAFVFSMLTRRSGSIAGAVAYHGASNAWSALLFAGYR